MKNAWKIALASACAIGTPVFADDGQKSEPAAKAQAAAPSQSMSEGEIRRIDKAAKKLTVRHGPLQNLGMPAMTMVFQVRDPSFLVKVKPGDKVKFIAEQADGAFTITALEPAK